MIEADEICLECTVEVSGSASTDYCGTRQEGMIGFEAIIVDAFRRPMTIIPAGSEWPVSLQCGTAALAIPHRVS